MMNEIYDALLEKYKDEVFGNVSKLSKEDFIQSMKDQNKKWLQPHFLRQIVFEKIVESLW